MISVFVQFTSLGAIISRSTHVAANGIISFFFMAVCIYAHCIYVQERIER